jgi:uncharacterized repeat protein (TIGR01451 family)
MKSFLRQIQTIDRSTVKIWRSMRQHLNAMSVQSDNLDATVRISSISAAQARSSLQAQAIKTQSIGFRLRAGHVWGGLGGLLISSIGSLPAQSAPLTCDTIYGSYQSAPGSIFTSLRSYTPPNSVSDQIGDLDTTDYSTYLTNDVAGIAIDPLPDAAGNRRVYYIENVAGASKLFYYDGTTSQETGIVLTPPTIDYIVKQSTGGSVLIGNTFNRMAFAPDGTLYIADGNKTFYRFTPDRTGSTVGGSISAPIVIADNINNDRNRNSYAQIQHSGGGDIAFDSKGRMYVLAYDGEPGNSTEFRLFQIFDANTSSPIAILLGVNSETETITGLAFKASDNKLYMQGAAGKSYSWDLATNAVTFLGTSPLGSADLGSCTYPNFDPVGALTKTVTNKTHPGATTLTAGDVLEYSITVTNSGTLIAGNTTLVDPIPTGTTYVADSTKLNSTAILDATGGMMPYSNSTTPKQLNSPGVSSGVLSIGAANAAKVVFQVTVNANNSKVCNRATFRYEGATINLPSDDPSTPVIIGDQTCLGSTGGITISGTVFNDIDGSKIQDGSETVTNAGGLNAFLIDSTNKVIAGVPVATNGTYQFSNVTANSTYTVQIATATGIPINSNPASFTLPTGWVATGENLNGTIDTSTTHPHGTLIVPVVTSNVTGANLGIAMHAVPILVKRITAINGNREINPNDTSHRLDTILTADSAIKWPSPYVLGTDDAGKIKPGDEIEYTIYYLNKQGANTKYLKICDPIRGQQTYVPNSMRLQLGDDSMKILTDGVDGADRAQSYAAGTVPANCNAGAIINGVDRGGVAIELTGTGSSVQPDLMAIPSATSPGTPATSYGWFRFKTKLDPQ